MDYRVHYEPQSEKLGISELFVIPKKVKTLFLTAYQDLIFYIISKIKQYFEYLYNIALFFSYKKTPNFL